MFSICSEGAARHVFSSLPWLGAVHIASAVAVKAPARLRSALRADRLQGPDEPG